METKKTYLNLYVSPEVKTTLEAQARREDRPLSNLSDRLLKWATKWLVQAGDSQTLAHWTARPPRKKSARISEETQEEIFTALEVIFERAPSAVIERVAEYLTERAGKYGDEK